MQLHHIAFWTKDIDTLVAFYTKYFDGEVLFRHQSDDFKCVFVKICSSINLEFMTRPNLPNHETSEPVGYSHFSVEVESKDEVNRLTDYFIANNIPLQKVKEQ